MKYKSLLLFAFWVLYFFNTVWMIYRLLVMESLSRFYLQMILTLVFTNSNPWDFKNDKKK